MLFLILGNKFYAEYACEYGCQIQYSDVYYNCGAIWGPNGTNPNPMIYDSCLEYHQSLISACIARNCGGTDPEP